MISKLSLDEGNKYPIKKIVPLKLIHNPPALRGQTSSEITANHLNEMHVAGTAFIKKEARTTSSVIYEPKDIV